MKDANVGYTELVIPILLEICTASYAKEQQLWNGFARNAKALLR